MTARRLAAALLVPALAACTGTDAAVIHIDGAVTGVRHLAIDLSTQNGKHADRVVAPAVEGDPIAFPRDVSLTFPASVTGYLLVHVEGLTGAITLAQGDGNAAIVKGGLTRVDVHLDPALPITPVDGFTSGDGL